MSLPLQLVERLIGLFTEGHIPQVIEGRLPNPIVSLPLPEGTTVAACYVFQPPEHPFRAVAALDTPLALEAFLEQMSTRLESDGWQRNEPEPYRSLFVEPFEPHFYPFSWAQPFFEKGGMVLMVEGAEEKGEGVPTEVRLSVKDHPNVRPPERETGGLLDLLVRFTMPEDAALHGWGGHWGAGEASGSVHLVSSLSSVGLAAHFAGQLERVGWDVTEKLVGARAALILLEREAEGTTYDARVTVLRKPGDELSRVLVDAAQRDGVGES